MKVNAGLFSLALAGFTALAAAQPHGNIKHRDVHGHHARRGNTSIVTMYVTEVVTVTGYRSSSTSIATTTVAISSPHEILSTAPPTKPTPSTPADDGNDSDDDEGDSYDLDIDPVSGKGVDSNPNTGKDFPDGKLDCNAFPSEYGAIPLTWVTLEGWSGIQVNGGNGDAVGKCVEGALCSYACPAGYSKSQWPEDQPASGESHGGLLCKGGKLHLTRPDYHQLCQAGQTGVKVKNQLKQMVSICRTDYPGSENMVVPLSCPAGSVKDLTVPIAEVSYMWQGMSTSAQYYVQKAGIDVKKGCLWGKQDGDFGNWTPMIFGAGMKGGKIWLSMSQNQLNDKPLGYNCAIIGGNSICKYENGQFSTPGGCTTAVEPGQEAYYVLY